jgi:hypothetical protein
MGVFTDMLPRIEAETRARDILAYLGCDERECRMETHHDMAQEGRWVRHNDETRFFPSSTEAYPMPVYRRGDPSAGAVAYIPDDMAEWITAQHPAIDARRAVERRAETEADPWRLHAAMLAGAGV